MVVMAQQVLSKDNLTFIGFDYWDRAVYVYTDGRIFKDITLKGTADYIPNELYSSADGTREGEPNNPYKFK